MRFILVTLWITIIVGSVLYVDRSFVDVLITPKWLLTLAVGFALLAFIFFCKNAILHSIFYILEIAAMMVCFIEAMISILQYIEIIKPYGSFSAGNFDNVAGLCSCLALSLPLGLDFYDKMKHYKKELFIFCKAICVLPIILYESRICILCVIINITLLVCKKRRIRHELWTTVLMAVFLLAVFVLSSVKTDSTRGRLFIYERTFDMIKEKPIQGWGRNGFAKEYMNYQERFFRTHPEHDACSLVGDIRHPLSDYLLIWVEYGSIAVILVLLLISLFIIYSLKSDSTNYTGRLIITSIITIATFSYPFSYPFTWIMLVYAIVKEFKEHFIKIKRYISNYAVLIIVLFLFSEYSVYKKVLLEKEWKKVTQKTKFPYSNDLIYQYASLYQRMYDCPEFLYNYSSVLYEMENYSQALVLAMESMSRASNYNVCLLIADIYRESGKMNKSILYFEKAHYMCPSRITPLYGIFSIYRQYGYTKLGRQLAIRILAMPDKVKSRESEEIRQDLYDYISHNH